MNTNHETTKEESFFAVFCIECLAEELKIPGNEVYKLLTEKSDILDEYIIACYDTLHTQGKEWLVRDIKELMLERGII
jgi:plasmid maintenance system antidote protein VapI